MALFSFRLHDIGEGVAEAEVVAWHVKVGDRVDEETPMVDVMTDKATVELASPVAGVVIATHGEIGQSVAVGSTLYEIELDQEDTGASVVPPEKPKAEVPATPVPVAPVSGDAPLAAPATRARAKELGIPLHLVPGTGPEGRVTADDLDAYLARKPAANVISEPSDGVTETKIIGLRRKIAERMQESTRRIPHFSYVEEFDLTELESLRGELNANRGADQPKLSLLPFFMRGLVKLVPRFPQINSLYDDDAEVLRSYQAVHIGIATQTESGLMVPVVRHAENRDLWDCAEELARVTSAARFGSATREELTGSTITLTSLGALGGIAATPVINRPEVAIIAPNKLAPRPVVVNGQIAVRTIMNLSSSFDHRIIDGHQAARFVQALKQLIEHPSLLFLERPRK